MDPRLKHRDPALNALESKISRRKFLKIVTAAAASVGLSSSVAIQLAEAATAGLKPSVISTFCEWKRQVTCLIN